MSPLLVGSRRCSQAALSGAIAIDRVCPEQVPSGTADQFIQPCRTGMSCYCQPPNTWRSYGILVESSMSPPMGSLVPFSVESSMSPLTGLFHLLFD